MKRVFTAAVSTVIITVSLVGLLGYFFLNERPETDGREVVFELKAGSFASVARELEQQGIITDAFKFKILARLLGETSKVRVGEYALRTDMTPSEVLRVIVSGKSIQHPLTVIEGANIFDVAGLVEQKGLGSKKEFLALCRNPEFLRTVLGEPLTSCEGYLFPETYGITRFMTEKEIIQQMTARFLENYSKIEGAVGGIGLNRHQLVTFASIVEKETGFPAERPIIASVYHNRLRQGMRLQADPTVLYGKWIATGNLLLSITREDLLTLNPYNTYMKTGLPAGPIANPGFEAMRASVHPAESEFLYFVSKNDGTHVFSRDYEAHNRAVQSFQQNAKAREGKSWRDLSKKKPTSGRSDPKKKSARKN
jgi:UPF0755 protein